MTVRQSEIAKSSRAFVIVGFLQGIMLVLVDYFSGLIFHPDLVIALILLAYILSNGGFHIDGLADTFDGIAVKSSGDYEKDKEKRLAVMKEGSTGAIGVTAILFVILLKYLSLKNISHLMPFTYYFALLFMPMASKWAMAVSMFHGKSARKDGIGKIFLEMVNFKDVLIVSAVFILFLLLPYLFLSRYMLQAQYGFYIVMLLTIYLACRFFINLFHKKFGGLTGDTLGAISEITELIFLFAVIIWSRLYI